MKNYFDNEFNEEKWKFLELLADKFPNENAACTEIINLKAILNLPKGTEHFLSDLHGEYEAFQHVLKNGSGVIKRKIERLFRTEMTQKERRELATLIYYPQRKLDMVQADVEDMKEWYEVNLYRLVRLCQDTASKYTRSKVRKSLPAEFAYIIDELLNERATDKMLYYEQIIKTIIDIDRADAFIIALCTLVKRFVIDRLHIIGDIYDRGPGAHIIMDTLMKYHNVDIQWGNHDILWMGAAAGSEACIANVIRVSLRYNNLNTIEDGYGINLRPLASMAAEIYKNDDCEIFFSKHNLAEDLSDREKNLLAKMHKAIAIIQFKLEGLLIQSRPKFNMDDRLLLDKIDFNTGKITILNKAYKLKDSNFPTVDPGNPYKLSREELEVIKKLRASFRESEKLQQHTRFIFSQGSLYLACNSNLLYHGCILMNSNKTLRTLTINEKEYCGRNLMDKFDRVVRQGYFDKSEKNKSYGKDIMWYLWSGADSPLFGKTKMATFERYFISAKETHKEEKNPYYSFREDEESCRMILSEFGLDPDNSHIINGHVPVQAAKGEEPVKAGGRLIVIDGGLSKAYQKVTGIAGYTLIYDSFGMQLVSHEAFESAEKAVRTGLEINSTDVLREKTQNRLRVIDTDYGKVINKQIEDLQELLLAYRQGLINQD